MKIHSFLVQGTSVSPIEIQVHFRFQIPGFQILGLAGPEIQEARERIIAAFTSSELEFPKKKVIVNLSPSDLKKSGTGHDLAMALAILQKSQEEKTSDHPNSLVYAWGALGLDGWIQPCGKMASLLDLLVEGDSPKVLYLCPEDARVLETLQDWRKTHRLSIPKNLELRVIRSLREWNHPRSFVGTPESGSPLPSLPELLPLLPHQERLLDIAIVGRHHTLILGPKGMGKSQMLEWFRWLSPESAPEKIWQRFLYQETTSDLLSGSFAFRSVHAQIKPAHLLGSWNSKGFRAGELSLAHGGILVADEFLEWPRDSKECLREPLQNKQTTISRVQGTVTIDCDFQLIATGNLCPCGGLPRGFQNRNSHLKCRCPPSKVEAYLERLSGPIADRIDLISLFRDEPDPESLSRGNQIDFQKIESKKRTLIESQQFALQKFGALPSELSVRWLETNFPKSREWEAILKVRVSSLRSRHKAMRVARTIQALAKEELLKPEHLLEALNFRFENELR